MAQAGYTPIQLYYSTTAAAVPTSGNLASGELGINIQDEKLYFKNAAGVVKLLASNATSAPVLSFSAGTTGFTPNTATTGAVTLAGTLATTNGGTGLTSFTSGGVVYASSSSALATGSAFNFNGTKVSIGTTEANRGLNVYELNNTANSTTSFYNLDYAGLYVRNTSTTTNTLAGIGFGGGTSGNSISGIANILESVNAGALGFYTGGASASNTVPERMRIASDGSVGIGTSSPSTKFHVASSGSEVSRFETTGADMYLRFSNNFDANGYIGYQNSALTFWTANNLRATLNSTGLGIGTTTLPQKLNIGGINATNNTNQNSIEFQDSNGNTNFRITGGRGSSGNEGYGVFSTLTSGTMTERMRIDQAGNVGIGVTPSAWDATGAGGPVLQIKRGMFFGADSETRLIHNAYYGTGDFRYIATDPATNYQQASGQHRWYNAPSGTAGNPVTFTQAMTLDASGKLLLGTTSSPSQQAVIYRTSATTSNGALLLDGNGNYAGVQFASSGTLYGSLSVDTATMYMTHGQAITFRTGSTANVGGTDRMVINSSGNVGIGTSSPDNLLTVKAADGVTGYISVGGGFINSTAAGELNSAIKFRSNDPSVGGDNTGGMIASVTETTNGAYTGLAFYTYDQGGSPALKEHLRIAYNGNVGIGTSSPSYRLEAFQSGSVNVFQVQGNATDGSALARYHQSANSGDNGFIAFLTETTPSTRGSITYNRAGGLVAYNVTSDYRAKDIYGPVVDSGALIDATPVYMGKMKDATQERPMFIAHETPTYAHTGEKDAVDKDGNPVYQQMDASALIPVMWAEIQSLRKRLADAGI